MHTHKGTLPLCVSLCSKDGRVDMVVGVSSTNKGQDQNCSLVSFAVLSLLQFKYLVHFIGNLDNQQASFDEIV